MATDVMKERLARWKAERQSKLREQPPKAASRSTSALPRPTPRPQLPTLTSNPVSSRSKRVTPSSAIKQKENVPPNASTSNRIRTRQSKSTQLTVVRPAPKKNRQLESTLPVPPARTDATIQTETAQVDTAAIEAALRAAEDRITALELENNNLNNKLNVARETISSLQSRPQPSTPTTPPRHHISQKRTADVAVQTDPGIDSSCGRCANDKAAEMDELVKALRNEAAELLCANELLLARIEEQRSKYKRKLEVQRTAMTEETEKWREIVSVHVQQLQSQMGESVRESVDKIKQLQRELDDQRAENERLRSQLGAGTAAAQPTIADGDVVLTNMEED